MDSTSKIKSKIFTESKQSISTQTIEEIDEAREKEDLRKLEAVFFVSARFLNMQELISLTDLNPIIISKICLDC